MVEADMKYRRASEESILAVQIFDQKKFKKKDQGFLGVINVRVGDVVDFSSGQDREYLSIVMMSGLLIIIQKCSQEI